MAHSPLAKLPPELLQKILAQLPVLSLLAFAQTSKACFALATSILTYLEIAVFPKDIHCMLAFLGEECREDIDDDHNNFDSTEGKWRTHPLRNRRRQLALWNRSYGNSELYRISRATQSNASRSVSPSALISGHDRTAATRSTSPTEVTPLSLRTAEFTAQNVVATTILTSRAIISSIKALTLHLYTLHTPALAKALASLPALQHLNLNFSHAYISDTTLPASYWRTTPLQGSGSTIWNSLAGIGDEASSTLQLRGLRTLTLRRAGITAFQLRSWISSNPNLTKIVLDKVRGVEPEFVDWLADYCAMQSAATDSKDILDTIILSDCSELKCKDLGDFDWITRIARSNQQSQPKMMTLSIKDCKNVDDTIFCIMAGVLEVSELRVSRRPSPGNMATDMDIDPRPPTLTIPHNVSLIWSQGIHRLVSPQGTLIKQGQRVPTHCEKQKMGARSPTLIINEGFSGITNVSAPTHRKSNRRDDIIEVDPDLL